MYHVVVKSSALSPPTSVALVSTTIGTAPLTVDFDASQSTDGDGTIVSYQWDFGDMHSNTDASTSHIYPKAGNFIAILTVTDNDGLVDTTSQRIEVISENPPILDSITITPTSTSLDLGQTILFTASGFDQFGNPIPVIPIWTVNGGGTIDESGMFTAETLGGPFTVTAKKGVVSGNSTISVTKSPLVISNISVGSGKQYQVFNMAATEKMYIDRRYKFFEPIPPQVAGMETIRTANNDKFSSTSTSGFLTFEVNQPVEVFILYTNINTTLEADWLMEENGWVLMPITVPTNLLNGEANRLIRRKGFPVGKIELPGKRQYLQPQQHVSCCHPTFHSGTAYKQSTDFNYFGDCPFDCRI